MKVCRTLKLHGPLPAVQGVSCSWVQRAWHASPLKKRGGHVLHPDVGRDPSIIAPTTTFAGGVEATRRIWMSGVLESVVRQPSTTKTRRGNVLYPDRVGDSVTIVPTTTFVNGMEFTRGIWMSVLLCSVLGAMPSDRLCISWLDLFAC